MKRWLIILCLVGCIAMTVVAKPHFHKTRRTEFIKDMTPEAFADSILVWSKEGRRIGWIQAYHIDGLWDVEAEFFRFEGGRYEQE